MLTRYPASCRYTITIRAIGVMWVARNAYGETHRFARSSAQQLVAPSIQQSRSDLVPAGDRRQRGVRGQALFARSA